MIPFLKFQAQGNDFVFINEIFIKDVDLSRFAQKVLDRHFGVGGDTLVVHNDRKYYLRFFNADGSEAEICVNSIFSYGLYLKTFKKLKGKVTVNTLKKPVHLLIEKEISVEIPSPDFDCKPLEIEIGEQKVKGYFTSSFGNPHFVILEDMPFEIAKEIEVHPVFPNRTNVNFLRISGKTVFHRVWERGVGETLSCASGVLSSFGVLRKLRLNGDKAQFVSKGGKLLVEDLGSVFRITGSPALTFQGILTSTSF